MQIFLGRPNKGIDSLDRLNRTASNIADTERFNPFCRLSQHRQRKALSRLRNGHSSQARSPPKTEESFDSRAAVVLEEPNRLEGPSQVDFIALEEGRLQPAEKEMEAHKTILGQFKVAMFNSWINVLLVDRKSVV